MRSWQNLHEIGRLRRRPVLQLGPERNLGLRQGEGRLAVSEVLAERADKIAEELDHRRGKGWKT